MWLKQILFFSIFFFVKVRLVFLARDTLANKTMTFQKLGLGPIH